MQFVYSKGIVDFQIVQMIFSGLRNVQICPDLILLMINQELSVGSRAMGCIPGVT